MTRGLNAAQFLLFAVILKSAALLVPRARRGEWLAEWTSELSYVFEQCGARRGFLFSTGAYPDALWLRRNHWSLAFRSARPFHSPLNCLLLLTAMAATAGAFFFRARGPIDVIQRACRAQPAILFAHLFMVAVALLLVAAIKSLSLGEYPDARSSPAHARRFHRWGFLALKFALVIPMVFCGTFDLATFLSASGLQPHAALAGYVIAFRWVLNDQRRRCPVCLRLLSESANIGEFSHNFLEWYGTELFCARGHGFLHVPAIATSYSTARWLDLDASWNVLFS